MEPVIWTAGNAPSRLPDEAGGSFASERDVLLWLGWSEADLAARTRERAERRFFGDWKLSRREAERERRARRNAGWERFKTWGKPLMQALERSRACVRIAYYIFRAQQNAGEFGACERFGELFERAAFIVGGILNRGKTYLWKLRNEVCEFVQNLWTRERKLKGEGLKLKERTVLRGKAKAEIRIVNNSETLSQAGSRDMRARVKATSSLRELKDYKTLREADFGAPNGAAAQAPGSKEASKAAAEAFKAAGADECSGFSLSKSDTGFAGMISAGASRGLPKFRGRFGGRGMFIVLHTAFECYAAGGHWDGDGLFSGAHVTSWLKACFASGKDMRAAVELYGSEIERMRGKGYAGKRWIPMIFAGLYERAAGLPEWRKEFGAESLRKFRAEEAEQLRKLRAER